MAYERINWQNGEAGNTPLNANNLNRMDMAIEEHEQKIGDHDYEIENLKTGAQGITEEINKKMDRINPQGSGTLSIPAVNADNITAQTVEADEIKATKVGSKGGTAPVVFENDIMVKGINVPIGGLATLAKASADHAGGRAEDAYSLATRANGEAASAINLANDNKVKIDLHTGLLGEGVGDKEPILGYTDGYYIAPSGSVTQYNATAKLIMIDFLDFFYSGDNIIFNHVDLLPTENCIPCAWYDISGNFISAADGLNVIAEIDEQTFKITKHYIDYCIIPVPAGASSCKLSGLANGIADIRIQTSLSDAIKDLQSKPEPVPLVLTNPSPLPATDGKKILGIDAKGNSKQNGTPTPTNPIEIINASEVVTAIEVKKLDSGFEQGGIGHTTNANYSANKVSSNTRIRIAELMPTVSGQIYTFTCNSAYKVIVQSFNESGLLIDTNGSNAWNNPLTVTASASMGIAVCKADNSNITPLDISNANVIMKGGQSNSIALPHTLLSVGTVADELIVNEDGSGKLIRRVGAMDLGTLNGWTKATYHYWIGIAESNFDAKKVSASAKMNALCDAYSVIVNNDVRNTNNAIGLSYDAGVYYFGIRNDSVTSASALVESLRGVTFQYELATPIETPLTPEEVASIRQLQTYKGTTIIDSEMQIDSVTYSGDVKGYVDSKTDYSYTDQIIGKWADGKDLHRMVIQANAPSTAGSWFGIISGLSFANADVKRIDGMVDIDANRKFPCNFYVSTSYFIATAIRENELKMYISDASYASKPCEIIVEYTLKDSAPAAASVLSLDETEE